MKLPNRESRNSKGKIVYPWSLLKEPKVISGLWAAAYSILALIGIAFITFTPGDLIDRNGIAVSLVVGVLLLVGGVCGGVSLHGGQWYMERAGLYFVIAGIVGYMGLIWVSIHTISESSIRTGFSLAFICVLLARVYKIRGLTLDPAK